ncbi:MAG: FAD-dependent oxidoreductase [Geminicoccaceae bacterium]
MRSDFDITTDVLVVGAGACGLAAAIAAHDADAEVAIVEKMQRPGGNSALSTGSIPAAGSRFQREAGIDDDPRRMIADLMRVSGRHDCATITRCLAEQSASLVEWLVDGIGARLLLITDYCHVGHSVPRLHAPRSRRGQDLVDDLLKAAGGRGIPLALGNDVSELIVEEGAVVGAMVGSDRIGAGKVVLATNGFAANPELVRRWCPDIAAAEYFGALGSTGEAMLWGEALGAELANMGAYQGYAAVAHPHDTLLSWTTIEKGGILVGADGGRFGNEDLGYSGFAPRVMAQGTFAYAVYDARIHEIACLEDEYAELAGMGGVRHADDASELAALMAIDGDGLRATLDAHAAAARGERADDFGRRSFGLAPLSPRYAIARVKPGLFHTQGGLLVDDRARVLRRDGRPIPNLFAGGGAAAGISGRNGAEGYASGNGLLTALGLGRIAGLAAAQEIRTAPR